MAEQGTERAKDRGPISGLRKRCGCPKARWAGCGHTGWALLKRVGAGKPPINCSIDRFLKMQGDTRAAVKTKAAATIAGWEIWDAYHAGTLDAIMDGKIRRQSPSPAGTPVEDADAPVDMDGRTFRAAADEFIRQRIIRPKLRRGKDVQNRVAFICRLAPIAGRGPVGDWPITSITSRDLEIVFDAANAGASPDDRGNGTRKQNRAALKRVIKEAVIMGWLTDANGVVRSPITEVISLPAPKARIRKERCKPELENRLIRAAQSMQERGAWILALIVLAIELGARIGELLALQAQDISLDDDTVTFAARETGAAKGGLHQPRTLRISDRARPFLRWLLRAPGGGTLTPGTYLFRSSKDASKKLPYATFHKYFGDVVLLAHGTTPARHKRTNNLTDACRAILRRLDVDFHDLRHECAIRWHQGLYGLKETLPINAIAALLGHKDLNQLRVYLALHQADALDAYDRATGRKRKAADVLPMAVLPFGADRPAVAKRGLRLITETTKRATRARKAS